MATAVMGNHAVPLGEEEQHLIVPVVPRERPAVVEHDGLPAAPILVEQLGAVTQCEVSRPLLLAACARGGRCLGSARLARQHGDGNRQGRGGYACAHQGAAGGSFGLVGHGESSRQGTARAANGDRSNPGIDSTLRSFRMPDCR